MSTGSTFASTFAPYTPPPDDPALATAPISSSRAPVRPWFPTQPDISSYQSGGLPNLGSSYGGGPNGVTLGGFGNDTSAEPPANQWETRFGMRVDVLAAFTYILGPISALVCLILETHNDYIRFHAYQSALATTPLILLRIFASLAHFPSFLKTFLTLLLIIVQLYLAFRAFIDAARNNLSRFYLPYVGPLADQWVSEE